MEKVVIQSGCHQYFIEIGQKLLINKINGCKEGDILNLNCLFKDGKYINGKIACEVLKPLVKGDKLVIIKKDRRDHHEKKMGFRHQYTLIKLIGGK